MSSNNRQREVYIQHYEKCKFEEAFFVLKHSKILSNFIIEKSRIRKLTEKSGVSDSSDFDRNTILVGSGDTGYNEYVFSFGFENIKIRTEDKLKYFISLMGNNMIPTATTIGKIHILYI